MISTLRPRLFPALGFALGGALILLAGDAGAQSRGGGGAPRSAPSSSKRSSCKGMRPMAHGTAGPATPAASSPASAVPGATTPGVAARPARTDLGGLLVDTTSWDLWWSHNRAPYLALEALGPAAPRTWAGESARGTAGASREAVRARLVPALVELLATERDTAVQRSALLALGRMGELGPGAEDGRTPLGPLVAGRLGSGDQAVAEAAVVALGLLGTPTTVIQLVDLATDAPGGRELVGAREVPVRLRALATYGLALAAAQARDPALSRFVVHHVAELLRSDVERRPDLQAAAMIALGATPLELRAGSRPDGAARERPSSSRQGQIGFLLELLGDVRRPAMVRAHAPTALAQLAGDVPAAERERVLRALLAVVKPRSKERDDVYESAVIALGRLGNADDGPLERDVRDALTGAVRTGDPLARGLAAIALAEVATRRGASAELPALREVTAFLLSELVHGKSRQQPWTGVALGLLGHRLARSGGEVPRDASTALLLRLAEERAPVDAAAYSVAAGLLGDARARGALEQQLERVHDPVQRGNVALALGLAQDHAALGALRAVMDEALHEPYVMEQAALARVLLGDASLVDELLERLDECDCPDALAGVTRALGWTGDLRALEPLLAAARDATRPAVQRGLAIEALGWIADDERLPRDTGLEVGLNYAAAPPTLSDPSGLGILEAL